MVYFHTKNWVHFGGSLKEKCWYLLEYFTAIGYILLAFVILWGYLVLFSRFGMFYQDKSGNIDCTRLVGSWYECMYIRFDRFILVHDTKTGKNVPNEHKSYQMVIKCPTYPKIFQMAKKYFNIFQSKALQNLPELGFLVWKQTIWQPWCRYILLDNCEDFPSLGRNCFRRKFWRKLQFVM
jgi:hypothetical protein